MAKMSYLEHGHCRVILVEERETYASVKKPTPATTQTLAWNQLGEDQLEKSSDDVWHVREFGVIDLG